MDGPFSHEKGYHEQILRKSQNFVDRQYIFTLGTIHLRRRQIFTIFDPYPPTIGIPAKCLWRGFLILMYCDLWTIGTWGHPSPLRHADVLNGWSLRKYLFVAMLLRRLIQFQFSDYSDNATTGAIYVMQNEFLRVPEFIEHYRNLSSHTSKSSEDPNLMQLIRSLLGLRLLRAINRLTVKS